ncbi:MAG: tyrosine-protein phosphatase [Bacilli bacterium]|nr:tyrosine-protein phosphatase [Bacilli bacterium]
MNKKYHSLVLTIFSLLLSSCGNGNTSSNEPEWFFSATLHWQMQDGVKVNQGTHQFSDWVIDHDATCVEDGSKSSTCKICHYKKEESLPKTGHSYGEWTTEGNISTRTCSKCGDVQSVERSESISFQNPFNGATVDLCHPVIRDLINHKNDDDYVATHLMQNRTYSSGKSYDYQTYIDINIVDSKARTTTYTLNLATDNEFTNIIDTYVTKSSSIRLDGILIPGMTYFYKVESDDGDYSAIDSFVTKDDSVRFITCGGVQNVRDIGGRETIDGKHIKYGLVYRGAGLNDGTVSAMDAKSREVFNKLGMRGELDLRENASTLNAWNPSLPHICVNGGWYTYLYDTQEKIDGLKQSLIFLSNKNNYPAYFHCTYGMDRTGTLAYILLGLLGVSEADIYLDYELTDYSSVAGTSTSHCERAVIDPIGQGQYAFNYTASKWSDGETLRTPVYKCINQFKTTYKGENLQASITKYLLEKVELPQIYIDRLKENLLF